MDLCRTFDQGFRSLVLLFIKSYSKIIPMVRFFWGASNQYKLFFWEDRKFFYCAQKGKAIEMLRFSSSKSCLLMSPGTVDLRERAMCLCWRS